MEAAFRPETICQSSVTPWGITPEVNVMENQRNGLLMLNRNSVTDTTKGFASGLKTILNPRANAKECAMVQKTRTEATDLGEENQSQNSVIQWDITVAMIVMANHLCGLMMELKKSASDKGKASVSETAITLTRRENAREFVERPKEEAKIKYVYQVYDNKVKVYDYHNNGHHTWADGGGG